MLFRSGFLVPLVPLPWMFRSYNVGACAFSILTSLQNLDSFVRAIVWRETVQDFAPIYCDICSLLFLFCCNILAESFIPIAIRIQVICNMGIPICSLVINRRLFTITRFKNSSSDSKRVRYKGWYFTLVRPWVF